MIASGPGNDDIDPGPGTDAAFGGLGDDSIGASVGVDELDGGRGSDTLDYRDAPRGIFIDLASGVTHGLGRGQFTRIENVIGSEHDDVIRGDDGANVLEVWGDGDDIARGRAGDDLLSGGYSDDLLYGGPGDDTLDLIFSHGSMFGGEGNDSLSGWYGGCLRRRPGQRRSLRFARG